MDKLFSSMFLFDIRWDTELCLEGGHLVVGHGLCFNVCLDQELGERTEKVTIEDKVIMSHIWPVNELLWHSS